MGLEIGALMALSSMPFTKESPGKGRIVQQSFIFFFLSHYVFWQILPVKTKGLDGKQ